MVARRRALNFLVGLLTLIVGVEGTIAFALQGNAPILPFTVFATAMGLDFMAGALSSISGQD